MGAPVARVNYAREKRLKDLDRQRKQEEKRRRKLEKGQAGSEAAPSEDAFDGEAGESAPESAPDVEGD